jgi:putative intracellular protease/amidase
MKVLIPLPDRDCDVTEVAVPWKLFTRAGVEVVFATEEGATPTCDPLLLTGVIFGKLGAAPEPKAFYAELERSREYRAPIRWRDINPGDYDGLFLPGGHAPGMRQYLGSALLQSKVAELWSLARPVGAICHGPLVLARARRDGRSLLADYLTTCLPKYLERGAYLLTAWKLGRYYRTYDAYVEDEVKAAAKALIHGPRVLSARGTDDDDGPAFIVRDRHYVSARWPGDAYRIAKELLAMLSEAKRDAA